MYEIVKSELLAPDVKKIEIVAPRVARKRKAGQFVIVRVHENGERIPLTIADSDVDRGTVTLVVQGIGKTTKLLNSLEAGDAVLDVVGPLGRASEVEKFGTAVVLGGGVGNAIAYPTAVALREAGNKVISIIGARTGDLLVLEDEIRAVSDETYVLTDDGTRGEKGVVTVRLQKLLEAGGVDYVLAIGPVPMMRAVAETTRPFGVKTIVSLNTIMVDGTGMCGGCRVLVGGESKFACVDGPEFDAHEVDFAVMSRRNAQYRDAEQASLASFLQDPERDLEKTHRCSMLEVAEEAV